MTFYVAELNDLEENENHFPVIYGLAVNTESAEIHRASFQDCSPEELPEAPALVSTMQRQSNFAQDFIAGCRFYMWISGCNKH